MIYGIGPQADRVYVLLRERILGGELPPGTKLPSHTELATEFGVAPMTVRNVFAHLEQEGLVSRQRGRGTFVLERTATSVLLVEDDAPTRTLLSAYVTKSGHRAIEAEDPQQALDILRGGTNVALVVSDVRMPTSAEGLNFIRAMHYRWPTVPVAAVTGYSDDLAELHGKPECPVLILAKPIRAHQIETLLRLVAATPSQHAVRGARR